VGKRPIEIAKSINKTLSEKKAGGKAPEKEARGTKNKGNFKAGGQVSKAEPPKCGYEVAKSHK